MEWKKVLLLLNYVIFFMKYHLLYELLYGYKSNKVCIVFCSEIIILLILSFFGIDSNTLMYMIMLIGVYACMQEKWQKSLWKLFVMFFIISCMDELFEIPFEVLIRKNVELQLDLNVKLLLGNILSLILLIVSYFVKKNLGIRGLKSIFLYLREHMHILVICMACGNFFSIAALNLAADMIGDSKFSTLSVILQIVSYLCVGMLGLFAIYTKDTNKELEESLNKEKAYNEMQIRYYEALLEKEEDTRRYRHDMHHHFLSLSAYVKENNIEELEAYLQQMRQGIEEIQKRCYSTGNALLDAITNHYLAMLDDEVKIKVIGKIEDDLNIDSMKLCTIYANLIQNAVEELLVESSDIKKELYIRCLSGKSFISIDIVNTIIRNLHKDGDIIKSSKGDERNHGFGIENVKKTVCSLKGGISITADEKRFTVKVILPKKLTA